jgi:hypothetical protein
MVVCTREDGDRFLFSSVHGYLDLTEKVCHSAASFLAENRHECLVTVAGGEDVDKTGSMLLLGVIVLLNLLK